MPTSTPARIEDSEMDRYTTSEGKEANVFVDLLEGGKISITLLRKTGHKDFARGKLLSAARTTLVPPGQLRRTELHLDYATAQALREALSKLLEPDVHLTMRLYEGPRAAD